MYQFTYAIVSSYTCSSSFTDVACLIPVDVCVYGRGVDLYLESQTRQFSFLENSDQIVFVFPKSCYPMPSLLIQPNNLSIPVFLTLEGALASSEGLGKQTAKPHPRFSDLLDLDWD